jgi:RNA polymerase sigma-70 factor (ECF subfamily)
MAVQVSPADVQRFLDGDENVLGELVRVLGPAIEAMLALRFPLLRPYAEDLLVDSLYRMWVHRQQFDPARGSLYAWWSGIAQNAAQDLLRAGWQQARAHESGLGGSWIEERAPSGVPFPADSASQEAPPLSDEERVFWEVFDTLPEGDRRILLYHALVNGEGHWAADLAGEMGLSAGAIRVRRLRSCERVRSEMRRRGFTVEGGEPG